MLVLGISIIFPTFLLRVSAQRSTSRRAFVLLREMVMEFSMFVVTKLVTKSVSSDLVNAWSLSMSGDYAIETVLVQFSLNNSAWSIFIYHVASWIKEYGALFPFSFFIDGYTVLVGIDKLG